MEKPEQNSIESNSARIIAVEDLKQNQQLSFKAMLDLFYLQTRGQGAEIETSIKGQQQSFKIKSA
jgi:hypothetical protein